MKTSLKNSFITNENLNDELFYSALAEELNAIMENELSKSYEDINPEIIDDCCAALTSIYEIQNGKTENTNNISVISSVIKKYKLKQRKKTTMAAACAAIAILSVGVAAFSVEGNNIAEGNLIKNAIGKFENLFTVNTPTTQHTTESPPETTAESTKQENTTITPATTGAENQIKSIAVLPPPGFLSTFTSRESISLNNFFITISYQNGEKDTLPISEATYEILQTQEDGLTEIKICYKAFTTSFYVTVLPEEKLNPVIITSLYGTFENSYSIEELRVFAVLSDGTEKEIPKSDCTITTQELKDSGVTETIVTVEYENCSFQFLIGG